ncbi:hypothetical protein [Vibrio intestinalis]|uniref:hypothetical protein n=1 Tax=Vibrio intestinalis TaxID=2933291 RepID=UPI0021A71FF7|nr:hypothetical protein [Vibrio intestinalis]
MRKLHRWMLAGAIFISPIAAAESLTSEQWGELFANSETSAQLVDGFAQYTFADNVAEFLSEVALTRPEQLLEVLTLLYLQFPDQVTLLTEIARTLGLENQAITIAAIEAGIDPTAIAEATAAGEESIAAADPVPNAPTRKDPVSAN